MSDKPLVPWRVLDRRVVFRDRWVHLAAERCQTGEGAIVEPYYIFDRADWGCILALDPHSNVVMVRVWRQGTKCFSLELPAGAIDPDDPSPAKAVERELFEETGYRCHDPVLLAKLAVNPANSTNFAHVFFARGALRAAAPKLEFGETLETVLLPFSEAVRAALDGRITHAVHVAALLLAREALATSKI